VFNKSIHLIQNPQLLATLPGTSENIITPLHPKLMSLLAPSFAKDNEEMS
jgi:hypothetical protein